MAAKVLGSSSLTRRDDRIERGNEVALAQSLLEQPQDAANARGVDIASADAPEGSRVLDVLRSPGEDLRNEQVLDVDQRNGRAADLRPTCASGAAFPWGPAIGSTVGSR